MVRLDKISPALILLAIGVTACSQGSSDPQPRANNNTDTGTQSPPADSGSNVPTDSGQAGNPDAAMMAMADMGTNNPMDSGSTAGPDAGFPMDAMGMSNLCPPGGPFGSFQGEVSYDVSLPDCSGNMVSIRELCTKKAVWMFLMTGW